MKYLPGGTGLREGSPPPRVPRHHQALFQGIIGGVYGAPAPQLPPPDVLVQDRLARSLESSGPSQSPGTAGPEEMKVLGRSGGGEGAEATGTLESKEGP